MLNNWIIDEDYEKNRPEPGCCWVKVTREIKDTTTGEIRKIASSSLLGDGAPHPEVFGWEEGNFACDCIRASLFHRAIDKDYDLDHPCGDDRFLVRLSNTKTGDVFYSDFDDENIIKPVVVEPNNFKPHQLFSVGPVSMATITLKFKKKVT